MGLIVKLVGGGLGMASEAIHDYRARSRSQAQTGRSPSPNPAGESAVPSSSSSSRADTPPEYVEVADEATAERLVRDGAAERIIGTTTDEKKKKHNPFEASGDEDDSSSDDKESDAVQLDDDEAAWELDDMAERVAPPSYADSLPAADDLEQMIRDMVGMAGPPPQPVQRLPCPVIIPQRRPRNKDRGFVRAYAPVLDGCGVSQDVFLKFQQDWLLASKSDPWIDVIFVAAGIVGFVPEAAAQIVGTVVQVVAGTAKELQSRHRRNTFLDRVNQDLFMPRGLYAMVMALKDQVPGQQPRGPLSRLAGSVGKSLFSAERMDINETVAKYSSPDPDMSKFKKGMKDIRLVSGKTYTQLELPEAAPLLYPDLDRAVEAERQMHKGKGKGAEKESMKDKFKGAGEWVQDYMDRKSQAAYERDHQGSSLAVPSDSRKAFNSRFSDPNHPANSGSLVSLVTGGAISPGRQGRRAARQERRLLKSQYKDERRMIRGKTPRGGPGRSRSSRRQRKGVIKRILSQDVLYLLIVNLPSEEEVQQSVADLERLMSRDASRT